MDQASKIAFIQAQTVCALAEIEGMKAANRVAELAGVNPQYGMQDFESVPVRYNISWNQVIEYLRDG